MNKSTLASAAVALAIVATACSSDNTATGEEPVFPPIEAPSTSELSQESVAITIDKIGVTSVVPPGWTETPDGNFTYEFATLQFDAEPSIVTTDPADDGFELLEQRVAAGRNGTSTPSKSTGSPSAWLSPRSAKPPTRWCSTRHPR